MKLIKSSLNGINVFRLEKFEDERGFFLESYKKETYSKFGIKDSFVQDNLSRSKKGVLRGLHYTVNNLQATIVTVVRGRILDVAVDLREDSETFMEYFSVELSDDSEQQIYIPEGFAHGFYVFSNFVDLHYKVSEYYDASDEGGIIWNDSDINIEWPSKDPIVSNKDLSFPTFKDRRKE